MDNRAGQQAQVLQQPVPGPVRRKLPKTRDALLHHFDIVGHKGFFTLGLYPDTKQPGELFITMSKEGSTVAGLMDTISILTSFALQYGVPLEALVEKLSYTRFEPSGPTKDPSVPWAKSIVDYIFRWIGARYLPGKQQEQEEYNGNRHSNGVPAELKNGAVADAARDGRERRPDSRSTPRPARDVERSLSGQEPATSVRIVGRARAAAERARAGRRTDDPGSWRNYP
jgi:ribonucleoside-diphosphate reductase alpha chain